MPTYQDPFAQAVMVAYCGWDPLDRVVDAQLLLDGTGTPVLFLPTPVTGVSAAAITNEAGDVTDVEIGVRDWDPNGRLTRPGCAVWPAGRRNITVTYSAGYESIPVDLGAALDKISGRLGAGSPSAPALSKRLGPAAFTYAESVAKGDLLLVEQMVLDRYRVHRAA